MMKTLTLLKNYINAIPNKVIMNIAIYKPPGSQLAVLLPLEASELVSFCL